MVAIDEDTIFYYSTVKTLPVLEFNFVAEKIQCLWNVLYVTLWVT